MAKRIKLDNRGINLVMASGPVTAATAAAASSVASKISEKAKGGETVPVTIRPRGVTLRRDFIPRTAFDVTLAHPAGIGIEAKRSPLTRAASASGLEVNGDLNDLVDYVTKSGKKRKATRAQVANWTRGR